MKKALYTTASFLCFCLLVGLFIWPGYTSDLSSDSRAIFREPLCGLKGVYVLVENLPDDAKEFTTREEIATWVELRLRTTGIPVLTLEEHWNVIGWPTLYVSMNARKHDGNRFTCNINLELNEQVRLTRPPYKTVTGTTWADGALGGGSALGSREHVKDLILELVDNFANDYLAVNPKK
ncbi:MAG TPA: hypothetical protein VMX94_11960 [Armatimonadota bacterium]|nr:hypothetical protein [Armatimonadota bacterium]